MKMILTDETTELKIDLERLGEGVNEAFFDLFAETRRYMILVGGAGSGKSRWVVQRLLIRLVTEHAGHRILVIRKVARTLRQSCFAAFLGQIAAWGWTPFFTINKQDMTITCKINKSCLLMVGCDDVEKLKSIEGISGIWIEEATELSLDEWERIDLRIRGAMPWFKQYILTFNPINIHHWLKKYFFDDPDEDTRIVTTTFLDNRFLDEDDRKKMAMLKRRNPSLYRIYGLGLWGVIEGLIYDTPKIAPYPEIMENEFYGLDFGFTNPTALLRIGTVGMDKTIGEGKVYLKQEIYQSGLTMPELARLMRDKGIDPNAPIYGDSAHPGSIEELRLNGFNCIPSRKGPGSVLAGIQLCQGLDMYCQEDDVELRAEFDTYAWQKIDGEYVEKPVKFKDHALDAMRGAIYTHTRPDSDYETIVTTDTEYSELDAVFERFGLGG